MPTGWKDVVTHQRNPNYNYQNHRAQPYYLEIKTGKQECPDCHFQTEAIDPVGRHTCPDLTDGQGNHYTVGDDVFAYTGGPGIIRARVEKYKKETGNVTVEWIDPPENASKVRFPIKGRGKILKAEIDDDF